jgi:tetratricopeptide (TPR) repeat protein
MGIDKIGDRDMKKNKVKLSVCMVLKNEGPTIRRCLDSVLDIVDEYVIGIDKSTNDNTLEEVNKFFEDNPKEKKDVYDYTWCNSFAEARNQGMNRANGEWILIMDGHEHFPDQWFNITEDRNTQPRAALKALKGMLGKEDCDDYYFHLYQQPFFGTIPHNFFMQPRIYRNGKSRVSKYKDKMLRFGRAAHNTIKYSRPDKSLHYPEIIIMHDAPEGNRAERKVQRAAMNIKQLRADIKKNTKDTRALFYLGNTYLETKDWEKAIKAYDKYLKYSKVETSETYQCYIHRALGLQQLKRHEEQAQSLLNAVRIEPNRRDAYLLLGDTYRDMEQYEKSLHYYNVCLTIRPGHSRMFQNGAGCTFMPHQQIAQTYKALGDKKHAIAHLRRAHSYFPNQGWLDEIKELSGEKKNIYIVDKVGSFTQDLRKHLEDKGYNVCCSKSADGVLANWADAIWCEWADENAAQLAPYKNKMVIRLHGYEAYTNQGLFGQIPWDCKKVVFVGEHIEQKMRSIVPSLNGQCEVIPNGVDISKFYIKEWDRQNMSIGYAGYLNVKKNPMRLAALIKLFPKYTFHLRVDWQDPFLKDAFEYEVKGCTNIVYHSRYKDLNDFWNQVQYVISTSDIESFSYNIAEAMAAGCQPLIYNWKGADRIWREEDIFNDGIEMGGKLKQPVDMEINRRYIMDKYPLDMSLYKMTEALIS